MSFIDNLFGMFDGAMEAVTSPLHIFTPEEAIAARSHIEQNGDSSLTINGITVPKLVAEQLKNAGISLSFLNSGQIEAAILACAVDCRLIDDPNATDFLDCLELEESEMEHEAVKEEEESLEEDELNRKAFTKPGTGSVFNELSEVTGSMYASAGGFRQKIKEEREQQRERKKRGAQKEDDVASETSFPTMGA